VQPKVLELCILTLFSRILLEEDDGHTNDVADVADVDDDDDDPVELFQKRQKRGKWWELIVWLPFPVMGDL
jgi:hypothetical protein